MNKYTKEQLLHYLKKMGSKLNRSPTTKEMDDEKKYPSSSTYYNRFGSWNNALKKADLKIITKREYTKKGLKEDLQLLAKELGRTPKAKDLKNKDWVASYSTYRKHFGSWKKSLKSAKIYKKKTFTSLSNF